LNSSTTGTFTWTPRTTDVGNYNVTFRASNALVGSKQTTIQVQRARRASGEEEPNFEDLPAIVSLSAPWPNPAPGNVTFALELPEEERVEWGVWDAQGRRVHTENVDLVPGRHLLHWTGVTTTGERAEPGIYFARFRVGGELLTRRFVRL
jgi:hypothetical protein